eukprot:scaffold14641_cov30-Cyclotella_meneghiniana.AAC.1
MDVMRRATMEVGCFSWNENTWRVERRMTRDVNITFISMDGVEYGPAVSRSSVHPRSLQSRARLLMSRRLSSFGSERGCALCVQLTNTPCAHSAHIPVQPFPRDTSGSAKPMILGEKEDKILQRS